MNRDKTTVIFRVWKDTKTVFALFPEVEETIRHCLSYEHVGQHGSADYTGCIGRSRPAEPGEYRDLKRELEGIGYNLKIQQRWTRSKS